ncbi:MAG: glycosyltransferase family 4 protein [Planctomycetes bacterium]|nr:glycosyltransferase family 4 protein [Planctomycetota bacterium]
MGTRHSPGPAIRILFVVDAIQPPLTGVGRLALALLRALAAQGTTLAAVDWRPNPLVEETGVPLHILPQRLPFGTTALFHLTLARRIAAARIPHDVLFDPSGYPDAFGPAARSVLLVHDLSMLRKGTYRPGKRRWFQAFYPRALRRAAALACVSASTRTELLRAVPRLAPDRVHVVPGCLDPDLQGALASAAEARVGGGDGVLFVGTLEVRKNLLTLLEAYAQARVRGLRRPLVLAGRPGFGAEAILARAGAPDLREHVRVLGAVDEATLHRLYGASFALVLPSREEGFGLPILEGFAAGLPVLTGTTSAMPEVAGDAALLADTGDAAALRDALLRLEQDAGLRAGLVARGRARLAHFAAAASARALLYILLGVAKQDARAALS